MKYNSFTPRAYKDYMDWLTRDKKIFFRINELIRDTARTPKDGIGKPEPSKHELAGHWSRRINAEHRLVYRVTEDAVIIISCRYHY